MSQADPSAGQLKAAGDSDGGAHATALAKLGLERAALPRHVAVIMDGNGRWARRRGLPRAAGHEQGAKTVRAIVTESAALGLEYLTLYSFSIENWKRPAEEVAFLMDLYVGYLRQELPTMMENNIRFKQIGRREGLSPRVLEGVDHVLAATAGNRGLVLTLAINYGSRAEITDAVRAIAGEVRAGRVDPRAIDEAMIDAHLYTTGMPDPDLLIRTAGEKRISNYLLWQISYAELHVSEVCWPEFGVADFHQALREYAGRRRKFGAVVEES
jgi:undecaprenyl diphosphate synthase